METKLKSEVFLFAHVSMPLLKIKIRHSSLKKFLLVFWSGLHFTFWGAFL